MSNRKHHFVPRFYLKAFESSPKRINLFNLGRDLLLEDVSLKDQCYKDKFYGPTDKFERLLALMESLMAPVISSIRLTGKLPNDPEKRELVYGFVALQILRTSSNADRFEDGVTKLLREATRDDTRMADEDPETLRAFFDSPGLLTTLHLPEYSLGIEDLRAHLICAIGDQQFITSDNPAFRYNQYCEGRLPLISDIGATCRGLQIFVPLSPKYCLLLYDGKVYKVGRPNSTVSIGVTHEDIETLNFIQIVSAKNNVYFSDATGGEEIRAPSLRAEKHRKHPTVSAESFIEVGGDNTSLIVVQNTVPNLNLDLSFVSIRRQARKVPFIERTHKYRKEMPVLKESKPELPEIFSKNRKWVRPDLIKKARKK